MFSCRSGRQIYIVTYIYPLNRSKQKTTESFFVCVFLFDCKMSEHKWNGKQIQPNSIVRILYIMV